MKKILLTGFAVVVAGSAWFGVSNQFSKADEAKIASVQNEDYVVTASDEVIGDETVSDNIQAAASFMYAVLREADTYSEIQNMDVAEQYVKDAIMVAEKKNAHPEVIDKLVKADQLTQEGISNQDISKLEEANQILLKADVDFNSDRYPNEVIQDLKSKIK